MKRTEALRGGRLLARLLVLLLVGCGEAPRMAPEPAAGGRFSVAELLGEQGEGADPPSYAVADPGYRLQFPLDHGPHPRFKSEWWYLTLNLSDADGAEFGGQFTIFRQALRAGAPRSDRDNPWATAQVYLGHLAMTDVAAGQHRFAERLSRGLPPLAGSRSAPFAVWLDDWRLESTGTTFLPARLEAGGEDFRWSLTLNEGKPRVLQGQAGFSPKGPEQASHYYSYPRLQVSGTLQQGTRETVVTGTGWLDREWSTSVLSAGQVGWDWFALQLDDGRDLMLFNLRREDCSRDPYDHGLLVAADGRSEYLAAERFELTPLRQWSAGWGRHSAWRPLDACRAEHWPLEWRVTVDDERFLVRAALSDQRMLTTVHYWEGLVRVFDEHGDVPLGRGYLELTGYAD
ncbi:MAG: lipocalin-like domain-containing protein [Pseudomonadota bacterium]